MVIRMNKSINNGDMADGAEKKTEGQLLSERLAFELKNCWEKADDEQTRRIFEFSREYAAMLDAGKTEREFCAECQKRLDADGYRDIEELLSANEKLAPGMKVYQNIHGKSLLFAVIGSRPVRGGVNIVGAHIDSPRIDLKTNPVYEDTEFAMLDTQYYGGIKKYQWIAIPLALHGVIIKEDGGRVEIKVGEEDGDPVFTITDLLPHLARLQMDKKAAEFISGEEMNVLAGSMPFKDEKAKDKVKLNLLRILNEKYGISEVDFAGAEIEVVPAGRARDVGFDRSMIGAYGHDDRGCAYAAFRAVMEIGIGSPPEKTCICVLTDKEEIGSTGNTGANSTLFENFIAYLCCLDDPERYSDIALRQCLAKSQMLSADVNSAVDPNYDGVHEKKNASYLGKGIVLTKYTGSRGKGGASEANAEFYTKVRRILDENDVQWQYGDMGKVDQGGGGTIALYVANLGVNVLDCGIPVLSMHAPFEVISKIDLYMTYRGYSAFLSNG